MIVPCLMIGRGRVMLPADGGPRIARDSDGRPLDVLDTVDLLLAEFPRLYVVDLDGVDDGQPQLDYLQEICRSADVWVDAGVRNADQAIDVLVTGARRAVLSSAYLESAKELRRSWKLSQDLVFEVEVDDGRVHARSQEWDGRAVAEVLGPARDLGLADVMLGFRSTPVDWHLATEVSRAGPTWIEGTFERDAAPQLGEAGAAGGIFHVHGIVGGIT